MRVGPRKVQAGAGLFVLVLVAVAAHLLAGVTGLLVVVLLVQIVLLLALLELRVHLPREVRHAAGARGARPGDDPQAVLAEHRREVEDLLQRHGESHATALRDAVVRLEAAITDAASPDRTG